MAPEDRNMTDSPRFTNGIRSARQSRGWTQDELARRTGLSRAGVSAIESGRLVPSTAAALVLARELGTTVETLFQVGSEAQSGTVWAYAPVGKLRTAWQVEVEGRVRLYPVEPSPLGLLAHDGVVTESGFQPRRPLEPGKTLILATCDPAVSLLADELLRRAGVRLVVLPRSSGAALDLLARGLVHAAGVHLAALETADGNEAEARKRLAQAHNRRFRLIRAANWNAGVAHDPGRSYRSIRALISSGVRWVAREPGSGARQCLDTIFAGGRRTQAEHWLQARDHQGVAEAIRNHWADAGVCLELASMQAGLGFLSVRTEAYELCMADAFADDPRGQALLDAVESSRYRSALDDLPGCDATHAGEWRRFQLTDSDPASGASN